MGKNQLVVVTGASGFIAKHVIAMLLEAGYSVRGTARNPKKTQEIHDIMSAKCGAEKVNNLELIVCDLLSDEGWAKAMVGADVLMHLAAYVPAREPKEAQFVVRPSLEGTERVLEFALEAGIKRVVMTSSIAAIGYGHRDGENSEDTNLLELNANHWTDVEGLKKSWAYAEAKTLAERRAWEIAEEHGIELTCICPSMVFGPAMDRDTSASLLIILRLMNGQVPMLPPGGISVVDVRDVAQIHFDAIEKREASGSRIIASAHFISFKQVAEILRGAYPDAKLPSKVAPVWLMKFLGLFSRTVRQIAADLETVRHYDGSPGAQLMKTPYRDGKEATLSAAQSLIELGLVKQKT